MSSMAQGLVFATAMAVSAATVLLLDFCLEKYFSSSIQMAQPHGFQPQKRNLKSCLASGGKKGEKDKKKKKRVRFAADVKEPSGNGEEYRRQHMKSTRIQTNCGMPANRMALYSGILRNRLQMMEFSY